MRENDPSRLLTPANIVVQNPGTPMKRILAFLAVLVVGSTPVFGQDNESEQGREFEKINELIEADSVYVPALLQAVFQGETEMAKTLVKEGEDINEYWYYTEDDPWLYIAYTPLELATALGHPDIMRILLDNGAETERDIDGIVTISTLRYAKEIKTAQLLLDYGANAAESLRGVDDVNIAQFFVDNGAYVNYRDEAGAPLHGAAWRGNADMVQFLISNGADVNITGETGETPLHMARNAKIAQILIDNGADIHADCDCGMPLHTAVDAGDAEVVQLLIDHGADVNAHFYGMVPLHQALYRDNKDVVQVLLDHGADVNAKNNAGHTPLDIVIDSGQDEIADLLREHGGVETE